MRISNDSRRPVVHAVHLFSKAKTAKIANVAASRDCTPALTTLSREEGTWQQRFAILIHDQPRQKCI
jgi:methylphosphotriester-DNA--protein-cysteine methyltransferase